MTLTPIAPQPTTPTASTMPSAGSQVNGDAGNGSPQQGFAAALAALLAPTANPSASSGSTDPTEAKGDRASKDPASASAPVIDPSGIGLLVAGAPITAGLPTMPMTSSATITPVTVPTSAPTSAPPAAPSSATANPGSPATGPIPTEPIPAAPLPAPAALQTAPPAATEVQSAAASATQTLPPRPVQAAVERTPTEARTTPERAAAEPAASDTAVPATSTPASAAPQPGSTPSGFALPGAAAILGTGPTIATTTPATPSDTAATAAVTRQVIPEVTRLASSGNGSHRITIILNPAHLGEVTVSMVVRDGAVRVNLSAGDNRAVQQALADGSTQLQRLLERTGASDARVVIGTTPDTSTPQFSNSSGQTPQNAAQLADHSGGSRGSSRQQPEPGDGQPRPTADHQKPTTPAARPLASRQLDRTL